MSGTSTFRMVTYISKEFIVAKLTLGSSTRTFEPNSARSPEINSATVTPKLGGAIRTLKPAALFSITF